MTTAARSARSRLLRRGLRHRQAPEGQLELAGIEACAGGGPVPGGELEVAVSLDPEGNLLYSTPPALAELLRAPPSALR